MRRKEFLAASTVLTAGAFGGAVTGGSQDRNGVSGQSIGRIGNRTVQEWHDWYRGDLLNRFVPNTMEYVIDHETGGFFCDIDIRTGERLSTNKRTWYEGRGMWAFSYIYNYIDDHPDILEVACKSKEFVLKTRPPEGEIWTSRLDRYGKPISGPGTIYDNLFVAEGLAEYAGATGEEELFVYAKQLILGCVERYDREDYRFYNRTAIGPEIIGPRVLGHWMVILISSMKLLSHYPDREIEALTDRCTEAIMEHHVHPEHQLMLEFLTHDMQIPENEFGDFVYLGVAIETLWMVLHQAERRRDAELYRRAAESFRRHVTVAHDAVYGGYFRSLDSVEHHVFQVDKVLWLQEEILIGTLSMIEHMNDSWAKEVFEKTFNYVQDHFVPEGYKFWIHAANRTVTEYRGRRMENYHHPRHLMLNVRALERMLERDGKTSGLLA